MKKAYMKPLMEACKVEAEKIICGSDPKVGGDSKGGASLSKEENMFDVDDIIPLW